MKVESNLERNFWTFWLGGLLLLAIMIAMNPWFSNEVSPWGIRDHQSAGTALHIDAIQGAWQTQGVFGLARLVIFIDLIYIAIYSFGAFNGGRMFAQSPSSVLAIADYAETICQFIQAIQFQGSDALAGIAAAAQPIKSLAFLTTFFGILIALFLRRISGRKP
jgi:hypothetical protein